MKEINNYINGKFEQPIQGHYIDNFDPSTGKVYGKVANSTAEDVELAVKAAQGAFSFWSEMSQLNRSNWLYKIADAIESRLDEFAELESKDQGKPISLAKTVDIPRACWNFRFFAGAALHHEEMSTHIDELQCVNYTRSEPIGVAGLISPWNLPLYLLTWKIAPAIVVGNTCVCKPSEMTSATAALLGDVLIKIGFPAGVINIVNGTGPSAGAAIVQHKGIPLISFTGGTKTGEIIMRDCSPGFKKVSLELGGKNAAIICEDVDIDNIIAPVVRGSFTNQGEVCLACSRIFVHKKIYDQFLNKFVEAVKQIKCGDPSDPSTVCGALISAEHRDKVLRYIEIAKKEGGDVKCGGAAPSNLPEGKKHGYYVQPTVVANLGPYCQVNQEEVFGPFVTVYPYEKEDEVIEWANSVEYGLAACLWTKDSDRTHRISKKLKTGTVWVNCWMARDLRVPFGGYKASGVGREGGKYSLEFYTEQKTICIKYN